MNDLIHFDAEPLPSTNAEENKFAVLNQMENVEPAKVKYEGMCQFMKTNVCKQILGKLYYKKKQRKKGTEMDPRHHNIDWKIFYCQRQHIHVIYVI